MDAVFEVCLLDLFLSNVSGCELMFSALKLFTPYKISWRFCPLVVSINETADEGGHGLIVRFFIMSLLSSHLDDDSQLCENNRESLVVFLASISHPLDFTLKLLTLPPLGFDSNF